jgi:NHLM bacteriocin system ABC transporter peptidase/ATP-binding protein
MEIAECGAAALAIILAYYDAYVPLEQMRVECGISRDGSNAQNMLQAAKKRNLEAKAVLVESLDELTKLRLPFIAHWEFNHFVVVEGIGKNKYYLNDPATGPRVVSRDEFDKSFTGVALLFEPKKNFQKVGKPFSLIKALRNKLPGEKSSFAFIILASLLLVIPGIMIPGFTKVFIDYILIRQYHDWFAILILGFLITAILRGLLNWLQQYHFLFLRIRLMINATAKFVWHILSLPVSFFQQRFVGDVQERIDANSRVVKLFSNELATSLVNLFMVLFYVIVMVLLDWQLTLIVILVAITNLAILRSIARRIADISRRFLQERGFLAGIEVNSLQLIETIKAMSLEDYSFDRWATQHAKTINSQQKIMLINQLFSVAPSLLSGLLVVVILGYGSWQIMQSQITVGTLVAFQSLTISFNAPVMSLLGLINKIQQIRGDLARLADVEHHPSDPRLQHISKDIAKQPQVLSGRLKLIDVTFGYSTLANPIIKDINFELKPKQSIAIIGKTGSGKSTIAGLICGLYQPWGGKILLDDKPLPKVSPQELAATISFVDQEITLFTGSVLDNLILWQEKCDSNILEQSLRDACILDEINARGGLSGTISAGAVEFSGGEKQRLEIARALANQPKLLILDEATSNIDVAIEQKIYENIRRRGCTLLTISHRLSAVRDCNEILVLDEGSIIERGTHAELMQLKQCYSKLISME